MDLNDEKSSRIFSPAEAVGKPSKKSGDSYYYDAHKKEYLVQNARGGWIALNETQFKRILKKEGFSTKVPSGGRISPLDELLIHLQRHKDVYYVGPLAGHPAGFYEVGETRILVTVSPKVIEPVKGEWPVLHQFLRNLFYDDNHDQLPYVYGWIKIAYESLRNGKRRPGQALVLAGPHNCGKSLFQNLLTLILGGRTAKPYQYMMGITSFNADLFEAEHLAMEDEHASTDLRTRRHFGSQLKNVTVNESQRCHGKHQKGTVLYPFWRVSVSLNDEPENLMVLPPIDDSLEDKLMLLRAVSHPMPMPTGTQEERAAYWNKLLNELPAFLDLLMSWEIPASLSSQRFGIKHFHHPDLLAAIDTLAPETRLLNLIDGELFPPYGDDVWKGSSEELERILCSKDSRCQVEARKLLYFYNACGTYLSRLLKQHPDRVEKHRDSTSRTWVIRKPKS
jgi:hypothetical protein